MFFHHFTLVTKSEVWIVVERRFSIFPFSDTTADPETDPYKNYLWCEIQIISGDVNTGTLFAIGAPQSQGQFCSWQSTSTGGLLARGVTSNFLLIDFLLSVTRRLLEEPRFVTGGTCCSGGKIWMSDCTPMVTVHRVWKIPMPGKISWSSNCVHRFCWRVSPSSHSSKAIYFWKLFWAGFLNVVWDAKVFWGVDCYWLLCRANRHLLT